MVFDAWFAKYKLLLLALIGSAAFHGSLLLSGSYRGTYDAYVHIFFADHYARSWWNPWEPRWYTGFTMFSYPPLTHQLTALLSKFSSLPAGFGIVMLVSTVLMTLGVYRFSRLWVGHRPAVYAALLTVLSSSVAETVHVFGQLPTMCVMGVMLNALPFVWRWLDEARLTDLFRAWALLMVAAAGHHVTTLFGMIFFCGPILATVLLRKFRTPRPDETEIQAGRFTPKAVLPLVRRRLARVMPSLFRCGVFGVGLILVLVITVLPYWLWSRSDPITQITIPHASRDSFVVNTAAGLVFFLIPWGMMLVVLPYALYKGFSSPNWILAASLAALAFLGTGGTTPLPAKLLGGAFYILTLDRFTFWATVIILPFAGLFVESLLHGRLGLWISGHFGAWWRVFIAAALLIGMMAVALFTANLTQFRHFQPATVNMTPIVEFLAKDNHDQWRYLTLGFGDQMAWLSAQTSALNVEGNYHSARRLPEMTSTPVERLDGAKFTAIPGLGSLQQFVTNPQKYHLKYVFVNDAYYEPLLFFAGWHNLGQLDNGVRVWERADVPPLPSEIPAVVYAGWQRAMWGTLPVGSLFVSAFVFFMTGFVAPRRNWSLTTVPIIRRIVRWRLIRFWLLDDDRREPQPASDEWQLWKRIQRRLFHGFNLQPFVHRAAYGFVLLAVLGGVVAAGVLLLRQTQQGPQSVILAYYDALDFQRYSDSYTFLDTPLSREEYMRWLSLRGGILASFAKLNNLYTDITIDTSGETTAHVTAEWLTALGTYTVVQDWLLRYVEGRWTLVLDVPAPPVPRETFIGTTNTNFFLDLPLSSLNESALQRGVLDRSLLSVSETRIVYNEDVPISFTPLSYDARRITGRFQGLISVIGAVTNRSSTPSDVTVTVILRDADGVRLAQTNAMDMMLHQLVPEETTPFRVDFSGAGAAEILDLSLIASVDVIVQGVPAAYNLERPLVILGPGELYNSGSIPVDIPRILVSYSDDSGAVSWVDGMYLDRAISPDRTLAFELPPLPEGMETWDLPITVSGPRLTPWTGSVPPLVVYGYTR